MGKDRRGLVALVFVPGLYVVLAASVALMLGLMWLILQAVMSGARVNPIAMLFIGLGAAIGIGFVVQAGAEALKPAKVSCDGIRIDAAGAPAFFLLLQNLCREIDCELPRNVVLSIGADFFVTEASVTTYEREVTGRTLCISAPLLRLLSEQELQFVLGHELAHFTGSDTVFSRWFYPVYRGSVSAIEGLSEVDHDNGAGAGYMRLAVALPLFLLKQYLHLFATLERSIGRERELRADKIAAEHTSSAIAVSALLKVHAYGPFWSSTPDVIQNLASGGKRLRNLSLLFGTWALNNATPTEAIRQHPAARLTHPLDTHPPLSERLAALHSTLAEAGVLSGTPPAALLFANLEESEERLSSLMARRVLGPQWQRVREVVDS